jgi:predicted branched-subunit amino acid permease
MTTTSPHNASALRQGARDAAPVALAYAPFGLALGATLAASHVAAPIAWSSSPLMFGGAAQLVAVQLLDAGANVVVVVLAALIVNARMLLYSAALAPHTADWSARRRWAAAYLLADPVYALAIARFERADHGGSARDRFRYYLSSGLVIWSAWMALTGAGVLLAGVLPDSLHLELAAPLTFLLLLLPMLTSKAAYCAAAAGGLAAVAASGLPLGLGLLVGAGAGIAVGRFVGGGFAVGGFVGARNG